MLSEILHYWLLQILALLADTLIEIQEQVLGCEDEVIMLPWSFFNLLSCVLTLSGTSDANSFLGSSRIANGKKSTKEMLKLRKSCYVPLNQANPHMTNLKQWLELLRSVFSFTYKTIPLNLIPSKIEPLFQQNQDDGDGDDDLHAIDPLNEVTSCILHRCSYFSISWFVSSFLFFGATSRLIWQVIWLIFCRSFRVETDLCLIIFAR